MVRLIKPNSVGHYSENKRHAVYSLDFQPNGGRLATGASDSCVKLWDVDAMMDGLSVEAADGAAEEEERDPLLATMSNHTKSVNIVRWSHDGKYLASGSDDCYILIYKFTPDAISNSSFGSSSSSKNVESWSRCAQLAGHTMDVLDLDWSPRGILASASIDNSVCIWDMRALGKPGCPAMHSPMRVLKMHENYVKGVSFDPMGKYLLSNGSDNIILVWDTSTWELTSKLTEPMKNSADRACSLFRRMSWAPDGQYFSATACTKSNRPVGMIIKRTTWESAIDLVGHEQPSLSTRFSPHVLVSNPSESESSKAEANVGSTPLDGKSDPKNGVASQSKGTPFCCVALGDALGVVSVWVSSSNQAVLVLTDVFEGKNCASTDISWVNDKRSAAEVPVRGTDSNSYSGRNIFACCSMDGTILLVDLQNDLGTHMEGDMLDRHFQKFYGRGQAATLAEDAPLLTDPSALKYMSSEEKRHAARTLPGLDSNYNSNKGSDVGHDRRMNASRVSESGPPPTLAAEQVRSMQQISRGRDGKKRIAPVLVQASDSAVSPTPGAGAAVDSNYADPDTGMALDMNVEESNIGLSVRNGTGGMSPLSRATDPNSNKKLKTHNGSSSSSSRTMLSSQPATVHGGGSLTVLYRQGQEMSCAPLAPPRGIPLQVLVRDSEAHSSILSNSSSSGSGVHDTDRLRSLGGAGGLYLTARRLEQPVSLRSAGRAAGSVLTSLCLRVGPIINNRHNVNGNGDKTEDQTKSLWHTGVSGEVLCIAATCEKSLPGRAGNQMASGLVMAGCADGTLHLMYLASGVRTAPPMVLGTAVVHVDARVTGDGDEQKLDALAMTADGEVWVWRIDTKTCQPRCTVRSSARPILMSMRNRAKNSSASATSTDKEKSDSDCAVKVERAELDAHGMPMLRCRSPGANGGDWQAFSYCAASMTWVRAADLRHVLSRAFTSRPPAMGDRDSLGALQVEAASKGGLSMRDILPVSQALLKAGRSHATDPSKAEHAREWMVLCTLSHLEDKVTTACNMRTVGGQIGPEKEEWRHWLGEWAAYCTSAGLSDRLRWATSQLFAAARDSSPSVTYNEVAGAGIEGSGAAGWGWLGGIVMKDPLDVVRTIILPGVHRGGAQGSLTNTSSASAPSVAATALLSELHESLELTEEIMKNSNV